MGMPSIGIYSYELYTVYGVENIIRVGSAGSYVEKLNIYDVVLAESAWSESTFAHTQNGFEGDTILPSVQLNKKILETAEKLGVKVHLDKIHSSDVFYRESNVDGYKELQAKYGCTCVEMESFALFHNAAVLGKNAACLLTISDSFVTKQETTPEERQSSFINMMKVALETFC